MKVGSLIEFRKHERASGNLALDDIREHGIVLGFDVMSQSQHRVVEVLWNTGRKGWVLKERMKIVDSN